MAGLPCLRTPDGTCFIPLGNLKKRMDLPMGNLIAESPVKSNGQRDSIRPAGPEGEEPTRAKRGAFSRWTSLGGRHGAKSRWLATRW